MPAEASNQVSALRHAGTGYDVTYSYTYDGNGNILSVSDGTNTTTYEYDSANQLLRENNQAGGYTHVWTYDNAGNILSRTEYAYTTGALGTPTDTVTYTYGNSAWGDLLTGYDGNTITSDQIGNTLSDGIWNYTWEHGRELASMTDGETTWEYSYNADGMRTCRTNGSTGYRYVYNGSELDCMYIQQGNDETRVNFTHAPDGTPLGFVIGTTTYYYVTNLQGDVVAMLDPNGNKVVEYTYDAWGNILSITGSKADTIGKWNPLRYRGYVYDNETGLYYVSSRYYDPEIGRWINADNIDYLGVGDSLASYNLFAYCWNNPVNMIDVLGKVPTGVLNIVDYYIIHKIVQAQCCTSKGWQMEIYVFGADGKGFLDLYDVNSNEYYEVKSKKAATRKSTAIQMAKYDKSYVKDKRISSPATTSPSRGSEYVSGSFKYGFWDIKYQSHRPGLITYTNEFNWDRASNAVATVASVLIAVIGYCLGMPSSIPAFT